MGKPKRHHYLPRFFLDGFSENGRVWVYDRVNGQFRNQQPKDTAVIGHFYSLQLEGGEKDTLIEEYLSNIEGKAKPVIDALKQREKPTNLQRVELARFLSFLLVRGPRFQRNYEELADRLGKNLMKSVIPDVEASRGLIDSQGANLDPESLLNFVQREEYKIQPSSNERILSMVDIALKFGFELIRKDWAILHAPEGSDFVLGDSAHGFLMDDDQRNSGAPVLSIVAEKTMTAIPLTSRMALFLANGGEHPTCRFVHIPVDSHFVTTVNRAVSLETERLLIGSSEDALRKVVAASRIDTQPTRSRMILEETPHPTNPLSSFVVSRRVGPEAPEIALPLAVEIVSGVSVRNGPVNKDLECIQLRARARHDSKRQGLLLGFIAPENLSDVNAGEFVVEWTIQPSHPSSCECRGEAHDVLTGFTKSDSPWDSLIAHSRSIANGMAKLAGGVFLIHQNAGRKPRK